MPQGSGVGALRGSDFSAAVERLGDDAGDGGFADAAMAGKDVAVSDAVLGQSVHERAGDMVLAGHVGEALRTVFAGQYLVSHECLLLKGKFDRALRFLTLAAKSAKDGAPKFILGVDFPRSIVSFRGQDRFFFAGLAAPLDAAFWAARLRRRISSGEYMVPRHFFAPQLQMASSSPPS